MIDELEIELRIPWPLNFSIMNFKSLQQFHFVALSSSENELLVTSSEQIWTRVLHDSFFTYQKSVAFAPKYLSASQILSVPYHKKKSRLETKLLTRVKHLI